LQHDFGNRLRVGTGLQAGKYAGRCGTVVIRPSLGMMGKPELRGPLGWTTKERFGLPIFVLLPRCKTRLQGWRRKWAADGDGLALLLHQAVPGFLTIGWSTTKLLTATLRAAS